MKRRRRPLPVIGWREWIALPELGIDRIKAKIDTGARTSALHAFDVRHVGEKDRQRVRFRVHPRQRDAVTIVECEAPLVGERTVRSSSGRATTRPVIRTEIRVGAWSFPIEVTLIRRDVMGFRMLLGRRAIRRRFLVHAGRSFLMALASASGGEPDRAAEDDVT